MSPSDCARTSVEPLARISRAAAMGETRWTCMIVVPSSLSAQLLLYLRFPGTESLQVRTEAVAVGRIRLKREESLVFLHGLGAPPHPLERDAVPEMPARFVRRELRRS